MMMQANISLLEEKISIHQEMISVLRGMANSYSLACSNAKEVGAPITDDLFYGEADALDQIKQHEGDILFLRIELKEIKEMVSRMDAILK